VGADAVARLVAGSLLGGIIGIQREVDDQPAGLRTHLSVALGAALFGVVSTLGFEEFADRSADTNLRVDVTRVASQVAAGIGFLGAGVIFRHGAAVRNLTTAASLWVTAAVGLAAGVGDVGVALVGAVAMLVALALLRLPRDWVRSRFTKGQRELRIVLARGGDPGEVLAALESLAGATVELVALEKADGATHLRVVVEAEPGRRPGRVIGPIVGRADVTALSYADEA